MPTIIYSQNYFQGSVHALSWKFWMLKVIHPRNIPISFLEDEKNDGLPSLNGWYLYKKLNFDQRDQTIYFPHGTQPPWFFDKGGLFWDKKTNSVTKPRSTAMKLGVKNQMKLFRRRIFCDPECRILVDKMWPVRPGSGTQETELLIIDDIKRLNRLLFLLIMLYLNPNRMYNDE